jgi:hypothetical protein
MSVLLVGSKYRLEGEGLQKSETGDKSIPEERTMEIPLRPIALIVELIIPKLSDFYLFSNSFVYKALKNHLSKMLSAIIKV